MSLSRRGSCFLSCDTVAENSSSYVSCNGRGETAERFAVFLCTRCCRRRCPLMVNSGDNFRGTYLFRPLCGNHVGAVNRWPRLPRLRGTFSRRLCAITACFFSFFFFCAYRQSSGRVTEELWCILRVTSHRIWESGENDKRVRERERDDGEGLADEYMFSIGVRNSRIERSKVTGYGGKVVPSFDALKSRQQCQPVDRWKPRVTKRRCSYHRGSFT